MPDTIRDILTRLHDCCTGTVNRSLADEFNAINGASYAYSSDLDHWITVLDGRPEKALYATAANEFALALLNNSQGQYRNAYKGLRLTLELVLQGVYLSANLVVLNEWLTSQADTSWSAIVDGDNGIFSKRFCRAFFPEVTDDAAAFGALSGTLYREMSECTHGNVPNKIPLPKTIEFNRSTFEMWHAKAETLRYISNFALTVRYYSSLSAEKKQRISPTILDQLGSVNQIRTTLEATA
ncbi:MAG: hypothetical protein PS018_27700 [bacterium]|nr:hypothetical protein [bacterium]